MPEHENPYQAPNSTLAPPASVARQRMSILRGTAYSILFAPFGFLIPTAYFLVVLIFQWLVNAAADESLGAVFLDDWYELLSPSIGIGVVFAISAFRNFASSQPIGMIRSLM